MAGRPLDEGLRLQAAGINVYVAPLKSKAPLGPWAKYQKERFPERDLRAAFDRGEQNLFVICGGISRLVVLDCDSDAAIEYWAERLGADVMEATAQVTTGKGKHYYFRLPAGKMLRSRSGDGWDLQAEGKGVVGPGSTHPSGRRYQWVDGRGLESMKAAPAAFWGVETDGRPDVAPKSRLTDLLADPASEGGRNNWLIRASGGLARKHSDWSECEGAIWAANESSDNPLPDDEVRKTVLVSARRYWEAAQEEKQNAAEEVGRGARYEYTDVGNARRFTEDHRGRLVYAEGPGWHEYTGQVWKPESKDSVLRYAKQTQKRIRHEIADITDDRAAEKCLSWARSSGSESRLAAMVRLAAAGDLDDSEDLRVEASDLDRDPEILNTPSGAVDLRTGLPVEGSNRDLLCTRMTAPPFDPDADMSVWLRVIERLLPDEDVRAALKRFLGAGVTGYATKALGVFYGPEGDNGKSVVIEAVAKTLGSYAGTAMEATLTGARASEAAYDLAELRGRRLVSFSETAEGRGLATERVKRLTGFDTITARSPYGRPFSYDVTYTLVVGTNHRPVIPGGEAAMWKRLWVFPFDVVVPKSEQIEEYGSRLARSHGPGILRYLVEGAREFLAADRKLGTQPAVMEQQRQAWKRRDDLVLRWVEARTERDLHSTAKFPDCFRDFQLWLTDEGESGALREYTSAKFHTELDAHYERSERASMGSFKRVGMRLTKGER